MVRTVTDVILIIRHCLIFKMIKPKWKSCSQDKTGNSKISSNDSNIKDDVEENISL